MDDEVREAERRFEVAFDAIADGILVLDAGQRVRYVNAAAAVLTGRTTADAGGCDWREVVPLADADAGHDDPHGAYCGMLAGDTHAPHAVYLRTLQAAPGGYLLTLRADDESDRLRAELADSRRQLEITLQRGKLNLWEWDVRSGEITEHGYWVGRTAHTLAGNRLPDSLLLANTHPDDVPAVRAALLAHLRGEADHCEVEQRIRRPDGSYMHMLVRGQAAECDAAGRVLRVRGTYVDISELREQEAALRFALENGRQGLWDWRPDDDTITFSREWYAMFGYPPGTITSHRGDLRRILHPGDVERGRSAVIPALRGERDDFETEHRLRHVDGHYISVLTRGHVVERDSEGRAERIIGTHVDITELKLTEQRLIESRGLLETVIDAFPQRVFWKDSENRYLGANRLFARDAGVDDPEELVGRDAADIAWPETMDAAFDDDRRLLDDGAEKHVAKRRFKPVRGEAFWAETTKVPIRAPDGEVLGVLGMYDDVSERISREQQMQTVADAFTRVERSRLLVALTEAAATLSGAAYAYVARFNDERHDNARVTACFPADSALRGLEYETAGTPCARTAIHNSFFLERGAREAFPHDAMLRDWGIEAYAGRRLESSDGEPVGLFVLLFRRPIDDTASIGAVIDIFAARATAELERENTHTELRASEERLNAAIDGSGVAVWEWFPDDDRMHLVGAMFKSVALDSGTALFKRLHPDDRPRQSAALRNCFAGRAPYEYEGRIRALDGSWRWMLTRGHAMSRATDGRVTRMLGTVTDITDLKRAQSELENSQQFLQLVIDTVPQAIFWQDRDFRYRGCNQQFADLAGVSAPEVLVGRGDEELWWSSDAAPYRSDDLRLLGGEIEHMNIETELARPGGETRWVDLIKVPMRDAHGHTIGVLGALHDITVRKQAEQAAQHLARFDVLTDLPNRRYFSERLEACLAAASRHRRKGALLFIDLDQFKHINDTLGHSIGDALLQAVADRLRNVTRQEDMVARLGGDEFVVLLPEIASELESCAQQARLVADKIHETLGQPFQFEHHQFHITPTIGITLFPEHDKSVDDVLKEADTAMYSGKADGRNVTRFFRREMEEAAQQRLRIEADLRKALVREEFELYFQPQVDRAGDVTGAEVLLRWHHPEHGSIPPGKFIPVAEERGLIVDIGRWILDAAFDRLKAWTDAGIDSGDLAINVSSRQFRAEDFVGDVERLLVLHRIPPHRVVFEITESTVIEDVEATIAIMERLRRVGIRFAIDDFGIGYSSLSYLKRLPIDQLKIDRSFIADIGRDQNDEVICQTIVAMSQHLRLETIAEGVESQEQYNFLSRLRCNGYQGYLFLPPSPESEFLRFCASRPGL